MLTGQLLLVLSVQFLNQQPVHPVDVDILQLVLAESLPHLQWSRRTDVYPTLSYKVHISVETF